MTTTTTFPELSLLPEGAPVQVQREAAEIRIDVPSGCAASLIERYPVRPEGTEAVPSILRVSVADGARLTHYKIVQEGPQADHLSSLEAVVGRDGSFESHVFLLGGARIRNTIQVRLQGDNANCVLNGLYMGTGQQVIETHTLIDHLRPHGTSRELYKGILDQKAQGLFDGLIVVHPGAQKTDSVQNNKNLLLSPTARAKSNPELKILANDVKCKHGSTIGQLDPTHLFYLRSRGIAEADARRLLIYAFARDMISQVELDSLRESLEAILLTHFQSAESAHV